MSIFWNFREARPGDRVRETQVEKFFNSDVIADRANAIVREGIQNSLDAAPDGARVDVRISVGAWDNSKKSGRLGTYTSGFIEHLNADEVHGKLTDPPTSEDQFRYLVFEDFGTSGLLGDPAQWWIDEQGAPNPFFNYFRAEGISDKIEGKRGRHGVGRLVFMFASRIHSIFGLTRRDDGKRLLMGTSVLPNHRVEQKPYLPDGWFGVPSCEAPGLTLPTADTAFLAQFINDFGLSRTERVFNFTAHPGLSR